MLSVECVGCCVSFLTRSVSVACIFSCMNLLQHIKLLPVLVCFRHRTTTSISVLQHWYHRRSIATGLAFSTHLYDGPRVFQSRVFHPCKLVSRFPGACFPPPPVKLSRVFQSRVFSRPAFEQKMPARKRDAHPDCRFPQVSWPGANGYP